ERVVPSGGERTGRRARGPDPVTGPAALRDPGSHARRSPLAELLRRHRRGDEETLGTREADLREEVPGRLVLDADGRRMDPASAGRADDGANVFERAVVAAHARH